MCPLLKKTLSVLLFFYCSHTCFATVYYISPAGSDETGNGSMGSPWRSLYKASSTVSKPGDIIHVMAGTYIETNRCHLAEGVSIEGEGDASVIKSTLNADWVEILRLYSEKEGSAGNQHISNLKFDGQNLTTYYGIQIIGRSNVEVHDITMVDFKSSGIFFDGRTDNVPAAPKIYATGNSFHDSKIHNSSAFNLSTGEFGRGALNIGGQAGMLVYNNTITQTERPDGYNGFAIKHSLNGHNKGLKIYNNVITKKPFAGSFGGDHGWDFSVELWHCEGGLEIYGNTFQGALDLLHVAKHEYKFGAWIHHNTISQPEMNRHYETGILFEKGVANAIVENNTVNLCSSGVEVFCEYYANNEHVEADNPYNPVTDLVIRNNQFTNISHQKGFGIHIVCGPEAYADMNNVSIYNNTISANSGARPYWGIAIQGIPLAKNIIITGNLIEHFSAAAISINPALLTDSLIIENNRLHHNGYNNKPAFVNGMPMHYSYRNNTMTNGEIFSTANFKMNVVRPVYYDLKSLSVIELVAILCALFCIWFCRKENIYAFPVGILGMVASAFVQLDQDIAGELPVTFLLIGTCIFNWVNWRKRNHKGHRRIRISTLNSKEQQIQWGIFAASFLMILLIRFGLSDYLPAEVTMISYLKAGAYAAGLTGLLLTGFKKTAGWLWIAASFFGMVICALQTNYILPSFYYFFLFLVSFWCFFRWKRRLSLSQKRS
ncbi:MAG: nicotinamide mononucleotide transporter [Ferruginibacter sp.]